MKIHVVSATRKTEAEFWQSSALGRSLQRVAFDQRLAPQVSYANSAGLPQVYNAAIDRAGAEDVLVFVHDDVWLDDFFFGQRIHEGTRAFGVIGVAGNTRRSPGQPAWAFKSRGPSGFEWDQGHLSGVVGHGQNPNGALSVFGFTPAPCVLLDGVLLAALKQALDAQAVRFDEQFMFHFYDLDFCRTARKNQLRLGTWPISLTHQSPGLFNSDAWREKYQRYLEKWKF